MDSLQLNKVYARISGTSITEYPVLGIHIQNRGEPLSNYVDVIYDTKPIVPDFHYAREVPVVEGDHVRVSYAIEALDLNNLLKHISPQDLMFPNAATPANIADVDSLALERVKALATIHVQDKLDAFAKEKGYDNLLAATSYKDSTVVQFSTEASIAIALRDQVWGGLYTYFEAVVAGTQPVPTSIMDIEAQLPAFTWPA